MLNTILSITYMCQFDIFLFILAWAGIAVLGLMFLIGLIANIALIYDEGLDESNFGIFFLLVAFAGGIVLLSFGINYMNESNEKYPAWYESEIVEVQYDHIYSLKLNNEVNGHFILGCGKVGTDTYYYFYVESNHDAYQLTKVKFDKTVYLKESDESPKVVERKDANSAEIYTLIYVPVGTIVTAEFSAV